MNVLRAISNKFNRLDKPHFTNQQVLADVEFLSFESRLIIGRIKYAIRFACSAPRPLVRLVLLSRQNTKSWIYTLAEDSSRLRIAFDFLQHMPDPKVSIYDWFAFFSSDPNGSQSLVRKISARLKVDSIATDVPPTLPNESRDHKCFACNECFPSRTQMLSQASNKHHYRSPIVMRICTTHCPVCGYDFHTRERIIKHIRRSGAKNPCAIEVIKLDPLSTDAVVKLEECALAAKLHIKKKALLVPPVLAYPI